MAIQILSGWRRARKAPAEPRWGADFHPVRNVLGAWSIDEARRDARIQEMVWKLQENYQFPDSVFESDILPIVDYTLRYFGPLPASQNHHHGYRFGAAIHALDVARRCMQMAQGMGVEEPLRGQRKAKNERAWYQVVTLASVLHDAGKPVTDMRVRDRQDQNRIWSPIKQTLEEFCADGSGEIHIEWLPKRHRRHEAQTEFLAGLWMARLGLVFEMDIHELFLDAIKDEANSNLARKIRKADSGSTEEDVSQVTMTDTEEDAMEPLIRTMKEMIRTRDWEVNRPGSSIYLSESGVHLVWPAAAKQILHRMKSNEIGQWQHMTPDEILDRLGSSGLVALHKVSGTVTALERFLPDNLKSSVDPLIAVRITRPEVLGLQDVERVKIRHLSDQAGRDLTATGSETSAPGEDAAAVAEEREAPPAVRRKRGSDKSEDDAREILQFLAADTERHRFLVERDGEIYGQWPEIFEGCGMKPDSVVRALAECGLAELPTEFRVGDEEKLLVRFAADEQELLRTAMKVHKDRNSGKNAASKNVSERQDGSPAAAQTAEDGGNERGPEPARGPQKDRDRQAADEFLRFLADNAGQTFELKDGVPETEMGAMKGLLLWRDRSGKAWLREEVLYQFSGVKTEFAEYDAKRIASVMRAEGVIIGDPVSHNHPFLPKAAEEIWREYRET